MCDTESGTPMCLNSWVKVPISDMEILRKFIYFLWDVKFEDIDAKNITIDNCKKALLIFKTDNVICPF